MFSESAFTRPCRRMTPSEVDYLKSLYRKCSKRRAKRQTTTKRTRKEYRALTAKERRIYHEAVRSLRNVRIAIVGVYANLKAQLSFADQTLSVLVFIAIIIFHIPFFLFRHTGLISN